MGIDYVVAPLEADAQLAYLESQGVVPEDSDLIAFGCKEVIVLKLPDIIGDLLLHCLYCKINMGN